MSESDDEEICIPPWNFSWIVKDKLAVMGCPRTIENLQFLYREGIRYLITLSPEKAPPIAQYTKLNWAQIGVNEFEAPHLRDIIKFIDICQRCLIKNQPVGIHCRMGRGRSGVFASCYLVHFEGLAPERAIVNVRIQRPGSVETQEQERIVHKYHDYLRGLKVDGLSYESEERATRFHLG